LAEASLLPMMKMRFAQPGHLIDLGKIAELKGIREEGGTLRIGAMTTENELIWSKLLQEKCPLLVEGARVISDPQVRYKGTIGGDISHGDPGNDHPRSLARVVRARPRAAGECVVPAEGSSSARRHAEAGRNHDRDPHPVPAPGPAGATPS
jgi:carbon-monoxide dehydrogenase medium subunit